MQGFDDLEVRKASEEHQRNTQEFLDAYIEVLRIIGGEQMVKNMLTEVRYRKNQGQELGEILADHYLAFKKRYDI